MLIKTVTWSVNTCINACLVAVTHLPCGFVWSLSLPFSDERKKYYLTTNNSFKKVNFYN